MNGSTIAMLVVSVVAIVLCGVGIKFRKAVPMVIGLVALFIVAFAWPTSAAHAQVDAPAPVFVISDPQDVGVVNTERFSLTITGGPVDGAKLFVNTIAFPTGAIVDGTYTVFTQPVAAPAMNVLSLNLSAPVLTAPGTISVFYDSVEVATFDIPAPPPAAPVDVCYYEDPGFGTLEVLINQPVQTPVGIRFCQGDDLYDATPVDPNSFATPIDPSLLYTGGGIGEGGIAVSTGTWAIGSTASGAGWTIGSTIGDDSGGDSINTTMCVKAQTWVQLYTADGIEVLRVGPNYQMVFLGWTSDGRWIVTVNGEQMFIGQTDAVNYALTPRACARPL